MKKADVRQQQNMKYLPLPKKEVSYWKTSKLCRHFGIAKSRQKDGAWLAEKLFRRFAALYQLPADYGKVASKAYLLQSIHKGILETSKNTYAGDIILSHPLKALTEEENLMLAATISCVNSAVPLEKSVKSNLKRTGIGLVQGRVLKFLAESVILANQQITRQDIRQNLHQNMQQTTHQKVKKSNEVSARHPSDSFPRKLSDYMGLQIQVISGLSSQTNDLSSPEVIHDIRVAFRKLLSLSVIFSGYLNDRWQQECMVRLKENLKILGSLRDLDIMQEKSVYFLNKSGYNIKDIPVLWKMIDEDRENRLSEVKRHCSSELYETFLSDVGSYLVTGVCRPVLTKGGKVMEFQNRQVMEASLFQCFAQLKAYDEWINGLAVPEPVLHQMRIAFKNMRYVLDFFSEESGDKGQKLMESCVWFQTVIGDLHDETVLIDRMQDLLQKMKINGAGKTELRIIKSFIDFSRNERIELMGAFRKKWKKFSAENLNITQCKR